MKILIHGRAFPVAMWRFFDWAFRDLGHEVISVGCYNGDWIPWGGGMNLGYDFPPDIQIPEMESYPLSDVLNKLPWTPDMILQASDVTYLYGPSNGIPNVILATDPHAVDYIPRLKDASHFACMQECYLNKYDFKNKFWIPYAYSENIHKNLRLERDIDVSCIGLQYDTRVNVMGELDRLGYKVSFGIGKVYDEYVDMYNRSKIAFVATSKDDLPARFWEGLAMGCCVVTNHVPDLDLLQFVGGKDYMLYESDPVSTVVNLLKSGEWDKHRVNVMPLGCEYKDRAKEILKHVFNA